MFDLPLTIFYIQKKEILKLAFTIKRFSTIIRFTLTRFLIIMILTFYIKTLQHFNKMKLRFEPYFVYLL